MHLPDCICDRIPTYELRPRLALVMHYVETRKASSSGALALASLTNSELRIHGLPEPERRVDVSDLYIPERRTLVLMPREVPMHVGHCKLLYEAAQLGAVIAPPMPAFYNHPKTIDDLVNHSVGRVLDLFGLDAGIVKRWEGPNARSAMPLKS